MKHKRLVAGVLSLALACTILSPLQLAFAEVNEIGSDDGGNPSETKGLEISKTAVANDNGTYTITLEAYATGSKVTTEVKEDVPTDIILVLDQSGSMTEDFNSITSESFEEYSPDTTNSKYYNNQNNLWYQIDGNTYVQVAVSREKREEIYSYSKLNSQDVWTLSYYAESGNLFVELNSGQYASVSVKPRQNGWTTEYRFSYKDGGNDIFSNWYTGWNQFTEWTVYTRSSVIDYTYTYTYTTADGKPNLIAKSDGNNGTISETLYKKNVVYDTTTRLAALKEAVTAFTQSVARKAAGTDGELGTSDDIDHRIAVVGFACSNTGRDDNYNNYQNTEVFIGSNQYKYGTAAQGQYKNAFQSMKTTQGIANVQASIDSLDADGATYINHGIEMANGIFDANPVTEGKRNRVVIVFTDGKPGYSDYDSDVAGKAIDAASTTKNTYNATVYTVGIFSGADATSAGNQNSNDDTKKANWFMQNLSSNNGKLQTPSYYLSAADADTLKNIFQQISNQIESGGSSTTLGSETVIRDVVAQAFEVPDNTSKIHVYTAASNGNVQNWHERETLYDARINIDPSTGTVSVSGFSFKDNWCGTETKNGISTFHDGQKLIIEFTVTPKEGFLGGNDVFTNTKAGVYENSSAAEPLFTFDCPKVNVPIRDVDVIAKDKNVYLYGSVTADQLKNGAVVTCVGAKIDLSKAGENYGLKSWQNQYVDIQVEIISSAGDTINYSETNGTAENLESLNNLTEDGVYTIKVTVSPKTSSADASGSGIPAEIQQGSDSADINVFKPVLTFKDSEVYYGDAVPTNYSDNLVSTVWKNGDISSGDTGVSMIGTAPTVDGVEGAAEVNVMSKSDLAVKITKVTLKDSDNQTHVIEINSPTDMVGFVHQKCNQDEEDPSNGQFWLHPLTCKLTVTKSGGASGEPYVFNIYKDGTKYSEVTIVGNNSETICELPVGTYTIEEDTGWSWRYTANNGNEATLSASNPKGTITCTNKADESKTKWLNGYSSVKRNIYGQPHTAN